MLTGGKWGDSWACPVCGGSNSGALLKCHSCYYKKTEDLDTSQKCVEKAAESVHTESTNSCQKTTKLVETKQDQPTDLSCNEKTNPISINKLDDDTFINEGIKLRTSQEKDCGGAHHHRYAGRFGE